MSRIGKALVTLGKSTKAIKKVKSNSRKVISENRTQMGAPKIKSASGRSYPSYGAEMDAAEKIVMRKKSIPKKASKLKKIQTDNKYKKVNDELKKAKEQIKTLESKNSKKPSSIKGKVGTAAALGAGAYYEGKTGNISKTVKKGVSEAKKLYNKATASTKKK